jgi:cystathionine beta-lyase family protein involved in aluminum resistance
VGRVGWGEVIEASPVRVGVASMVGVLVRDPDGVLARVGPLKRVLAAANRGVADTPVWISAIGLPADDIADLINSYRAQWALAQGRPR